MYSMLLDNEWVNNETKEEIKKFLEKNENEIKALAGVAQSIEHRPGNQRVVGLIPSQGTCLGCCPGPQ